MHALARDERRLTEERESFRSRRQEYSGFSRGDMLSGQGSAAPRSASLRRSVRPPYYVHLSVSASSSMEVLLHASCQETPQDPRPTCLNCPGPFNFDTRTVAD